ncbi:putative nuclease HARBI1 [Palaemon carinicauda]|uniref:putative nuclease HARBI1 n=1 Tax=Palaemon carinicauda TaxID=392227 RepID=UPI0035B63CA0
MTDNAFRDLLSLVSPKITKKDTVMRKSIPAEERLIATLRFLATGRSLEDLKFSTGISTQALGHIISETCQAIYDALRNEYLKFPTTSGEWKKIADDFYLLWNFPNCGGAIDGKHVSIVPPSNSGSYYFNYKGYFSVVLMAIVNANLEFLMVDVGKNGRISDGGIIEDTVFHKKLIEGTLNLPQNNETKYGLNFVFIGDESFALHEHLLNKTFPPVRINWSVVNSNKSKYHNLGTYTSSSPAPDFFDSRIFFNSFRNDPLNVAILAFTKSMLASVSIFFT